MPTGPAEKQPLEHTAAALEAVYSRNYGLAAQLVNAVPHMDRKFYAATLLKRLLAYVSRDEARHTGYGIKYLSHVMAELSPRQVEELEDFAFELARKLVDSRQGPTMRRSVLEIWREEGLRRGAGAAHEPRRGAAAGPGRLGRGLGFAGPCAR